MSRSCRASTEGLEKAKGKFKLKGWTQDHLAGRADCTRQTVGKFFARQLVDQSKFQTICHELGLEWGDVAEFETGQISASMNAAKENTSEIIQESSGITQLLNPLVLTTQEKPTRTHKAMVVLSAKLTAENQAQLQDKKIEIEAIVAHLRQLVGDVTLTIKDVEEGSIKITLEGSGEGIERLAELFESGELTEVLGIPVEDIQLLPDDATQKDNDKSRLIREIVAQGARDRDLSSADLSDAYLNGADLSGADLSGANLNGANLNGADLSGADLSGANLSGAYLMRANLFCTNLNGANLSSAYLSGAYLRGVNLNEETQIDNKWRLVWEIVNQQGAGRNLSNADLSNADLSHANLSNADLSNADLSRANLSRAKLNGANLNRAKLNGASLNLADLSHANLSDAILDNAIVINAFFGDGKGLTKDTKLGLKKRGAIFGDRPPVLNPNR
jgi:uncharacterized protein YjbI with pentapeptide repeats/transcriptional regulator with XRE-family HTH domain